MATLNTVKVKGDKFEPSSQDGHNGDTVPFANKRDQAVTVTLDANFFNPSSLTLAAEGQSGDSGNVNIIGTSGTGNFKAPKKKKDTPEQDEGDIKGDIVVHKGEPYVIELAARLSGGFFCTREIPLNTGVDFIGAAIKIALG
jgi:hypothetical protein